MWRKGVNGGKLTEQSVRRPLVAGSLGSRSQPLEDLFMHAAEGARRHHEDDVARLGIAGYDIGDGIEVVDLFCSNTGGVELFHDRRNGHHLIESITGLVPALVE